MTFPHKTFFIQRKGFPAILTLLLALLMAPPFPARGEGCAAHGREQVLAVIEQKPERMDRHVTRSCSKALEEVRAMEGVDEPELRQQRCRKRVLAATYLDVCLHFRDVVCAEAFEPCWAWAREQHRRCVAGDLQWFKDSR